MFGIGMTELMVIFVIALLVLGPKRLPGLARSLGKGLAEFRRASTDMRREFLDVADEVRIDPQSFSTEPDAEPTHEPQPEAPQPEDPEPKLEAQTAEETPDSEPRPAGKRGDD